MPEPEIDPVVNTLERYRDSLVPGAVEQLATLFSDLRDMPAGVIADLVRLRLQDSAYGHFRLSPGVASGKPSPDDQLKARVQSHGVGNLLAGRVRHPAAS